MSTNRANRSVLFAAVVLHLAAPANRATAQPALLSNARLTSRAVAPGALSREIRLLASGGDTWAAYAVHGIEKGHVCCFETTEAAKRDAFSRGGCRLDREGSYFDSPRAGARPLEASRELLVFLKLSEGRLSKVRVFSGDCALDAGGRAVVWLVGVSPDESVATLSALVPERELADEALTAIALHDGAAAEKALRSFVEPGPPVDLRTKAAFWLGSSRGRAGYETLKRVFEKESSPAFRREACFAFSQSSVPEAMDDLIGIARRDVDAEVRGQALFWLAQKAGEKAIASIDRALAEDPDDEVRVKAVFALTQLPRNEGIPRLIRLARSHKSAEVREQAFFWLGQSKDARALDFIEEILTR